MLCFGSSFAIMDKAIFGFAGDASGAEDNL